MSRRDDDKERRRAEIVSHVPDWYRPWLHLAFPSVIGAVVAGAALSRLHALSALDLLAVPVTLFASFGFEWRVHKYVLHRKVPLLGLIYRRHELMHHVIYTYDDMAMRSGRELWLILMPAYAIFLVFLLNAPFVALTAVVFGQNSAMLVLATSMFFFLSYEWLHMAYHQPADSFLGRRRVIQVLREVHRRHHDPALMKRWNFNVTVPVFDWLLGTLWSPERQAVQDAARARRTASRYPAKPASAASRSQTKSAAAASSPRESGSPASSA